MASNDILVTLRADMKDLQNSFKSLQNNLTGAEKNTTSLSNVLSKIGKVAGLAVLGKQVIDLGKDIVETGKSFEYEMSKVSAISGATGDDFIALTNLAKELGSTTAFSASEASQGMQYLSMAGWKTQDIMAGLPAILNLSIASGSNLARVADIASDAMTGFGMQANEAGHFADVLAYASSNANVNVELLGESFKYVAPLAQTTNQSMETVASAISKLGDAGIKGSEAGTALRAILNRLASGNASTVKAMNELGVAIYDNDGKMRSINTIIGDVTRATAGMSDEQKNNYFTMIAGMEALSAWNVLMGVGEEGLNSFTAKLEKADGSAQAMADTMSDNLKGSIDSLESALEGLKIALYEKVKEPVRAVVDGITEAIDWVMKLDKWFNTHKGTVIALGSAFLILTAGIAGFNLYLKSGAIIGGLTTLAKTISTVIKVAWGLNVAFLANPATWVAMGIMALVLAGIALWKNWDTVKAKAVEVWGTIKEVFSQTWEAIKTKCSEIWNAVKGYLSGVWNSIKEVASSVWTAISNFFVSIWEGIKNCFNIALEFIKGIVSTVFTVVKTIVETIWNAIVAVFQAVWDKIGGIVKVAVDIVRAIIVGTFQAIMIFIAMIWTGICTVFKTAWDYLKKTVFKYVTGVYNDIKNKFNEVKTYITNIVNEWKTIILNKWNEIKTNVLNKVNEVKTDIVNKWNEIKSYLFSKLTEIKNDVVNKWNEIKTNIVNLVTNIKTSLLNKWNEIKTDALNKWNAVKADAMAVWNNVKSAIMTPVNNIKTNVTNAFNSLKLNVLGAWNGIKSGIAGVVNGIIRTINSMIGAMNKFSFAVPEWVPVMGGKSFGFNIPKIPEVSWHAKGGIFTKPTVIGNHGFGEAGKEAILPLHKLPKLIGIDKQQELIDKILAGEAGATGGGNTSIHIEHFENNREQDVAQLAKELEYYRQRYNFAKGVR